MFAIWMCAEWFTSDRCNRVLVEHSPLAQFEQHRFQRLTQGGHLILDAWGNLGIDVSGYQPIAFQFAKLER